MKNFLILLVCLIFVTSCTKEEFQQERDTTIDQVDSMAFVVIQVYVEYTENDTTDAQYDMTGLVPFIDDNTIVEGFQKNTYAESTTLGISYVHSFSKYYYVHKDSLNTITDNLRIEDFTSASSWNSSLIVNISIYDGEMNSEEVSTPIQDNQLDSNGIYVFAPSFDPVSENLEDNFVPSQINNQIPINNQLLSIPVSGISDPNNENSLNLSIANGNIAVDYDFTFPFDMSYHTDILLY